MHSHIESQSRSTNATLCAYMDFELNAYIVRLCNPHPTHQTRHPSTGRCSAIQSTTIVAINGLTMRNIQLCLKDNAIVSGRYYQCATCVHNIQCQQESSRSATCGMALRDCTNSFRSTSNPVLILTVASMFIDFKLFIKAMRSTPDLPHPLHWALVVCDGVTPDLQHTLI